MAEASITIDEIARLCGVKPSMVRGWIEHGQLAAVTEDRQHVRIRGADLETMVVACARARAEEARKGDRAVGGPEVRPRREPAPGRRAHKAKPPAAPLQRPEALPVIAGEEEALPTGAAVEAPPPTIAHAEAPPPTIARVETTPVADSYEPPVSTADGQEALLAIPDDDDTSLIGRVFFRPDGRWRWTMFLVWPLLWLVAVLASIELAPLLH